MRPRPIDRERALYEALRDWQVPGAVVIGGYAVSAWAYPRYSHDIDFILPSSSLGAAHDHLAAHDFVMEGGRSEIEQNYGGAWERWVGRTDGVTVDLLVDSCQDRDFQVPLGYAALATNHVRLPLRGLEESQVRLPVAAKEVLIALKLQPLRLRDRGDICCLVYTGYDKERLARLLVPIVRGRSDLLRVRLDLMEETLGQRWADAQRFLGPRMPGFSTYGHDVVGAVKQFLRHVRSLLPEPPAHG